MVPLMYPMQQQKTGVDKRECCLQEIRQTEEKYSDTLESILQVCTNFVSVQKKIYQFICTYFTLLSLSHRDTFKPTFVLMQHFMKPLKKFLQPQDIESIFINIEVQNSQKFISCVLPCFFHVFCVCAFVGFGTHPP